MPSLSELIELRTVYDKAVKKAGRSLPKEVVKYLSAALPDGCSMEWTQGDGISERFETEAVCILNGSKENGYFLDQGAQEYANTIPGLTKAGLRVLIRTWVSLPPDLLDKAFGDASIKITSDGKLTLR